MATAEDTKASMQLAVQYQQSGQLDKAEEICVNILNSNDRHGDACHLLGIVNQQKGRSDAAVELLRRAIAIDNRAPRYHASLGGLLALKR